MIDDKVIEHNRYNTKSEAELKDLHNVINRNGAKAIVEYLRSPYLYYENLILNEANPHLKILDMCCGNGIHSLTVPSKGISIVCTDIAENSLIVAAERARANGLDGLMEFIQADAASQPFESNYFDLITCAGSLSYFDKTLIIKEVTRLLKFGGKFIVVDSFNHNPIYRLNRFIHFLRGERTWSTLRNMPNEATIAYIRTKFSNVSVKYFGVIAFLALPISIVFGKSNAKKLVDYFDAKIPFLRKYSFKITIIATK